MPGDVVKIGTYIRGGTGIDEEQFCDDGMDIKAVAKGFTHTNELTEIIFQSNFSFWKLSAAKITSPGKYYFGLKLSKQQMICISQ